MLDGIGGQLVDNHAHGQGRLRPELDLGAIQPQPCLHVIGVRVEFGGDQLG